MWVEENRTAYIIRNDHVVERPTLLDWFTREGIEFAFNRLRSRFQKPAPPIIEIEADPVRSRTPYYRAEIDRSWRDTRR